MKKERYPLPDIIRGCCLISMILFHASWDLVYLFDVDWPWFQTIWEEVWQQSICWTFILLAGFCVPFSSHPVRRGILVFSCGAVISVVTLVCLPEQRILFGVLTLLGCCMMLVGSLEPILRRIPPMSGMLGSFLMFLMLFRVNDGVIGLGSLWQKKLPDGWYGNYLTTFLGFPTPEFFSGDYFSILPWSFLFLTGYFAHFVVMKSPLKALLKKGQCKPLAWLGRHSLLIYMLHQPILYGVLWIVFTYLL